MGGVPARAGVLARLPLSLSRAATTALVPVHDQALTEAAEAAKHHRNRFPKEPRMPRITRLIAVAASIAALAAPATAAAMDLRGEFAKGSSAVPQGTGADLRGEFAQDAGSTGSAQGTDVRGEFAKTEYRADTPPADVAPVDVIEPTDSPSELPYIVSGLVLLLGFGAIAIAVPLRRRVRVEH